MRLCAVLAASLAASAPSASAQVNVSLLGRVPLDGFVNALHVHDRHVFLMQGKDGDDAVYIYDVDDPAVPVLVSRTPIPGDRFADMHGLYYSNDVLYVGINLGDDAGFLVYDVSDRAKPARIGAVRIQGGVHNMRLAGERLYTAGGVNSAIDLRVFDVSDPTAPNEIGQFDLVPGASFCHDLTVRGDRAWAAMWDDGLLLLDVTDPAAIVELTRTAAGENTHSAWPTGEGATVVTVHEAIDEGVKTFDATVTPPAHLATWEVLPAAEDMGHDVMVVGHHAYVSYYEHGLRILDIADPANPVEVGSYVTGPGCSPTWWTCDATAQWVEDGRVYLLDNANGLWIFSFDLPHAAPAQVMVVRAGDDVELSWRQTGEIQYTVRRSTRKDAIAEGKVRDVDARARMIDAGVVGDGTTYFYRINGPWR